MHLFRMLSPKTHKQATDSSLRTSYKFIIFFNTGDEEHILFFIDIIFITIFMIRLIRQKQYPAWRKMFKGDAFTAGVKLRLYFIHKQ